MCSTSFFFSDIHVFVRVMYPGNLTLTGFWNSDFENKVVYPGNSILTT